MTTEYNDYDLLQSIINFDYSPFLYLNKDCFHHNILQKSRPGVQMIDMQLIIKDMHLRNILHDKDDAVKALNNFVLNNLRGQAA